MHRIFCSKNIGDWDRLEDVGIYMRIIIKWNLINRTGNSCVCVCVCVTLLTGGGLL